MRLPALANIFHFFPIYPQFLLHARMKLNLSDISLAAPES